MQAAVGWRQSLNKSYKFPLEQWQTNKAILKSKQKALVLFSWASPAGEDAVPFISSASQAKNTFFFPLAWGNYYSLSLQIQAEFFLGTVPPEFLLASLETARTLNFSIETNIVSLLSEEFVLPVHKPPALGHSPDLNPKIKW